MKTNTLWGVVGLVLALGTSVACAPAAPAVDLGNDDDDITSKKDKDDDDDDDAKETKSTPSPQPPPPAATVPDAGPPPPPPPAEEEEDDSALACSQLSACCGNLTDTFEKLACLGAALAGDKTACMAALLVCTAGGTGFGGDDDDGKK